MGSGEFELAASRGYVFAAVLKDLLVAGNLGIDYQPGKERLALQ